MHVYEKNNVVKKTVTWHSWPNRPTVFVLFLERREHATFVPDIRVDASDKRAGTVDIVLNRQSHYFVTKSAFFKKIKIKKKKFLLSTEQFYIYKKHPWFWDFYLIFFVHAEEQQQEKHPFSGQVPLKYTTATCDRRFYTILIHFLVGS